MSNWWCDSCEAYVPLTTHAGDEPEPADEISPSADIRIVEADRPNGAPVHVHALDPGNGRVLAVVSIHAAVSHQGDPAITSVTGYVARSLSALYHHMEH